MTISMLYLRQAGTNSGSMALVIALYLMAKWNQYVLDRFHILGSLTWLGRWLVSPVQPVSYKVYE